MSSQSAISKEVRETDRSLLPTAIRALSDANTSSYRSHLLRLSGDCRRSRFGNSVSDKFVREYTERLDPSNTLVLGWFDEGELRGAAELRALDVDWRRRAEIAFSVEKAWQGRGIGKALMLHSMLVAARNLALDQIYLSCHAFNRPMVRIAERAAAVLEFSGTECLGTIAVHKELQPEVSNVLSDVVRLINLPRSVLGKVG